MVSLGSITEPDLEYRTVVAVPLSEVWAYVGDPTRTPAWSPVCHQVDWVEGSTAPAVGARFRGHNRLNGIRWTRVCEISAYQPQREIAYSTEYNGKESTRWRYRLREVEGGTEVEESYQIVSVPAWVAFLRALPGGKKKNVSDAQKNISGSLERLKAVVEGRV
ncbi:MAG TPA: SRPBCC family protein [Acidimicrobiales bacterium]|nr:SRPBCC family protein [Acidimicrobiales bacterium]